MSDGTTEAFAHGWFEGLKPEPALTVSEWADEHRHLSQQASAEPGRWRTERTPYLREIMDHLSPSSPVQTVVFQKGSQLGGTECGNNWLAYIIHHAPGPMLYVQPTLEMAKRTSKQRIAPMIEACPALRERVSDSRSRDSGNTLLAKEFPGGILVLTGANSAIGLRSMPVRYLFLDEIDGFDADVDGEGDPAELARRRTTTFSANRKVLIVSTPTLKGLSRVEQAFEATDQRYYNVPCPHCGTFQVIQWANIQWPKDKPEKAQMKCEACRKKIHESHKAELLRQGRWVASREGDGLTVGYHLSGLYSPPGWYSWAEAAKDFLDAKSRGRESLKVWTNTVLAETWEEEGDAIEENTLLARCEPFNARVPKGVLLLTAGVDTQDDRLEMEIVGWGPGEETWGIEYRVLWGNPAHPEVWEQLSDALAQRFQHEDGYELNITACCVDSGGHHTQAVYKFCKGRQGLRHFAIKGVGGPGYPIVAAPKKRRTGRGQRHVELFTVGADQARALVHSRAKLIEPGPGYCHFSLGHGYDREYFTQLASMKAVIRYTRGVPQRVWELLPGRRKEAFDCRIYATAALYILNPLWDKIVERRERSLGASEVASEPRVKKKRRARRPGGNWVTGWKSGW